MDYIKIFSGQRDKSCKEYRYLLESSFEHNFKVAPPQQGTFYSIFEGAKEVAKADYGEIFIRGKKVKAQDHVDWVLAENPLKILEIQFDNSYTLDGIEVARITAHGDLFSTICDMLIERKWKPFRPYLQIDFDREKIGDLFALCLLVTFFSQGDS